MRGWRNGLGTATGFSLGCSEVWQWVVWIAVVGLCVGLGVGFFMLPGGFDLVHFYSTLPASRSGSAFNTYNPYWTYFFTWPLALVGWRWNYLLLLIATMGAGVLSAWLLGGRPLVLLLSLPMAWVLWLGQIDALPLLGVALGWWCVKGNRWWLLGLALGVNIRPVECQAATRAWPRLAVSMVGERSVARACAASIDPCAFICLLGAGLASGMDPQSAGLPFHLVERNSLAMGSVGDHTGSWIAGRSAHAPAAGHLC